MSLNPITKKDDGLPAAAFTADSKTAVLNLHVGKDDKPEVTRKFLRAASERVGIIINQEWLSQRASYDIDITVTMTKRGN